MTLGSKLDLNDANVDELRLIPSIGPSLAAALVTARAERDGFRSWDEVDAVVGVGPAKLDILKRFAWIGPLTKR
jgi:competence protein ComEA